MGHNHSDYLSASIPFLPLCRLKSKRKTTSSILKSGISPLTRGVMKLLSRELIESIGLEKRQERRGSGVLKGAVGCEMEIIRRLKEFNMIKGISIRIYSFPSASLVSNTMRNSNEESSMSFKWQFN